jgi:hypothetical protein
LVRPQRPQCRRGGPQARQPMARMSRLRAALARSGRTRAALRACCGRRPDELRRGAGAAGRAGHCSWAGPGRRLSRDEVRAADGQPRGRPSNRDGWLRWATATRAEFRAGVIWPARTRAPGMALHVCA